MMKQHGAIPSFMKMKRQQRSLLLKVTCLRDIEEHSLRQRLSKCFQNTKTLPYLIICQWLNEEFINLEMIQSKL